MISDYFPPPESKGGWRSLLPDKGEPTAEQKAEIAKTGGVDWDKLKEAWDYNAQADGGTGLLVIRHGHVVGEWYKDGDRDRTFNIYSSSKSYTSLAYGLILADWERAGPATAAGRRQEADARHEGLQRGMAAGVAAAARPAQGRHHGAQPAQHGVGPRRGRHAGGRDRRSSGRWATSRSRRSPSSRPTPARSSTTPTPASPIWCCCSTGRPARTCTPS